MGTIRQVKFWANFTYGAGNMPVADTDPPAGVDYDRWLGPAPKKPFNRNRFHGSWRMFRDYGGGLMTDWGVHLIDMGLWAMDVKSAPLSVQALGGNFANRDRALERVRIRRRGRGEDVTVERAGSTVETLGFGFPSFAPAAAAGLRRGRQVSGRLVVCRA